MKKTEIYQIAVDKNVLMQCNVIRTKNDKIIVIDSGHDVSGDYLPHAIRAILGLNQNEYFEIEVAPNGSVFFAKILNDNGLKATFLKKNFKTSVTLTEKGYDVEIVIPYSSLGAGEHPIYFNAFRIETEGGIPDKNLLALSPTLKTTFHVPEKFILFPQD